MLLPRFSAPGQLEELSEEALGAWSDTLSTIFDDAAALFPHFYNPTIQDTPADHEVHDVRWPAFPGTLLTQRIANTERWQAADADRQVQDEYCEWSVSRSQDGKIRRVTFTSETPAYYEHLLDHDPQLLQELYNNFTGSDVDLGQVRNEFGYVADNPFNSATDGSIVHLSQSNNTLGAAVRLAGDATILRERNGARVVHPAALVRCGGLGVATRHSDPQIAAAVNNLVATGFDITLADPPGLYLDRLDTTGMQTPDGKDASGFWTVERGAPGFAVRCRFEVPRDAGYTVSDIVMAGRPIAFGSQLAERVRVRLRAIARPGGGSTERRPCIDST